MIAYFIIGPESSGTKMLTEAIIKASNAHGQWTDKQLLGNEDFIFLPPDPLPDLVLRRSLPHGDDWPNFQILFDQFKQHDYTIKPIYIYRDTYCTLNSQVQRKHIQNIRQGEDNIRRATTDAFTQLAHLGYYPLVVNYEAFVTQPKVRELFFQQLGLPVPNMDFTNENTKYLK